MYSSPKLRLSILVVAIFFSLFGPVAAQEQHKTWDYPPFGADDIALYKAFEASCSKFVKMNPDKKLHSNPIYGTAGQWQSICRTGLSKKPELLEDYLNTRLTKVKLGGGEGKFTGYYKPVLEGSRKRHGEYQTPLLARPSDLTVCNGETGRKTAEGCRNPYRNRAEIMKNISEYKVILWLKDPVDAFFMQVQGSGTVELDDGTIAHVGFAGKNGHPYVAIGKTLKDMGAIKGTITAPKIREWLKAHKGPEADEVLYSNPSFIFFKESETESPGAFGIALTAGRSMAVDRAHIPMGVPVFIKSKNTFDALPWERVMFAQDVGSAIKGANRGDIYFGHGDLAGDRAGDQNAAGQLSALVPKENVGMDAVAQKAEKAQIADIQPAAGPLAQ